MKGSAGSTKSSRTHRMLMSAGLNWHLFDVIDIVKYGSGDTVHLPTSNLIGGTSGTYDTEQMDIPGVPKPDIFSEQIVSWGIIDGTQIGYIYSQGWAWNAETEFFNAVDSLMRVHETTGLIIDFRLNWGGNMYLAHAGLELLFQDTVRSIKWNRRCNASDHFLMCEASSGEQATIYSDPATYYDKPIAVLTGPGAISSGDQIALRMAFHPRAKFFGKPTDGAFNSPANPAIHPDFYCACAYFDASLLSDPDNYLTRKEFPSAEYYPEIPFEEVWLTRDGVAQGRDDVVEAAINWILAEDIDQDGFPNDIDNCIDTYNPDQIDLDGDNVGDACDDCICSDFCNMDGASGLSPTDVVYIVNFVYKQLDARPELTNCPTGNGDWNCGDAVNPVDVVYYVNFVYKNVGGGPCDPCLE